MDNEQTMNPRLFLSKAMMTGALVDGHIVTAELRIEIAKFLMQADQERESREAQTKIMQEIHARGPFGGPGI